MLSLKAIVVIKLIQLRTIHILSPVAKIAPPQRTVPRIGSPLSESLAKWGSLAKLVNITPITIITMVYGTYSIL